MATIILILFILYTLACVADGPDVKPKWKEWLGKRLKVMSNALYPIQYGPSIEDIDNPFMRQPIQVVPGNTMLIQSDIKFGVCDFGRFGRAVAQAERLEIIERQVRFSKLLKISINDMLMNIGRMAYRQGLVSLKLTSNYETVVLHGEMRITEPDRLMCRCPFVLFEGVEITMPDPQAFVDMELVDMQQIQL